jgi:hypothetical protein
LANPGVGASSTIARVNGPVVANISGHVAVRWGDVN